MWCTWPNETASWNASANSARYAPNLERHRNQPILVTLRVSDSRQNQRLANDISYSGNITAIRPVDIYLTCCQKAPCGLLRRGPGCSSDEENTHCSSCE